MLHHDDRDALLHDGRDDHDVHHHLHGNQNHVEEEEVEEEGDDDDGLGEVSWQGSSYLYEYWIGTILPVNGGDGGGVLLHDHGVHDDHEHKQKDDDDDASSKQNLTWEERGRLTYESLYMMKKMKDKLSDPLLLRISIYRDIELNRIEGGSCYTRFTTRLLLSGPTIKARFASQLSYLTLVAQVLSKKSNKLFQSISLILYL